MQVGIRQLKDGELSRVLRRAMAGEEVIITDHGRPIARLVPFADPDLPPQVHRLAEAGHLEIRAGHFTEHTPIPMAGRGPSAADYVHEQRR